MSVIVKPKLLMEQNKVVRNGHHLFWPASLYSGKKDAVLRGQVIQTKTKNTKLATEFRSLECLKVGMDLEVHQLVHRMFADAFPKQPSESVMTAVINRHKQQLCSCSDRTKFVVTNLLAVGQTYFPIDSAPDCFRVAIDIEAIQLIDTYYRKPHSFFRNPEMIDALALRHTQAECSCLAVSSLTHSALGSALVLVA